MGLLTSDVFPRPCVVCRSGWRSLTTSLPHSLATRACSDAAGGTISLTGKHSPSSQHCVIADGLQNGMPCRQNRDRRARAVYAPSPRAPRPSTLPSPASEILMPPSPWEPFEFLRGGPRPPPYNRTRTVFPVPRNEARGWPSIVVKRLRLALALRVRASHTFHRHLALQMDKAW